MPLITQPFFFLIIAIYCGRTQSAALNFQAGQSDLRFPQYSDGLTNPPILASDTASEPNTEFPITYTANMGSDELAEVTLSEHNILLSSCSSNNKRDSATNPLLCKPENQPVPSTQPESTQPAREFNPKGQIQNSDANRKPPWWEKIPGASQLFRQPSSNAIPPEFEQSNICNDPNHFYIFPVCSMQPPFNPSPGTTLLLNHCRACTIIPLQLLFSLQ